MDCSEQRKIWKGVFAFSRRGGGGEELEESTWVNRMRCKVGAIQQPPLNLF